MYGQPGYNQRVFDPLQVAKEVPENLVSSSSDEDSEDESPLKHKKVRVRKFKDNSLNSDESREIMTSGSRLFVPKKEKQQRVKSYDLTANRDSRKNSG